MIYYIPKYFKAEELVDPETYKNLGNKSLEICFDNKILWQIDSIRDYFNKPIKVNNWHTKGKFKLRGYRPFDCTTGSLYSQHKFGRAFDFDVDGLEAEFVRNEIIKNQYLPTFKYITRIEDGVNWVHIDCQNTNRENGILLFKP